MTPLLPNQVHIWITRTDAIHDASLLAGYHEFLSPEEKERQRRFYFEKDRKTYLCTRALVRSVLSEYATVKPHEWEFERNEFEKPEIKQRNEQLPPLRFNLSHTDKLVACTVTLGNNIGIDVENRNRAPDLLDIADRYFSPQEVKDLNRTPLHERRWKFFEYWTLKEAYIKACGKGLNIPLNAFSMDLSQAGKISISFSQERRDDPLTWQFHLYHLKQDYYLSLVVETPLALAPERVQIWEGIPRDKFTSVTYPTKRRS